MKNVVSIILSGFCLCNCVNSPSDAQIQDKKISDRVKACSAGFSETVQTGLNASLNKTTLTGDLSAETKQETKSIIFSQIPDGDKVKAYEDYIKCIEGNWNIKSYHKIQKQ